MVCPNVNKYQTWLLYLYDLFTFVYTSVSDMAYVWFWYVTSCWYKVIIYQTLLLYGFDVLSFVETWVSDFAIVLMCYVTFCLYYICNLSDIAVVLIWYGTFCRYMSIRFFSCIDVICSLLFILVYQILLCVGVICAIVDLSDILLVWYSLNQFIVEIYLGVDLHMHLSILPVWFFNDMWYCLHFGLWT